MRIEIAMMVATLLVAVAGTSEDARSYLGGTLGVITLLILTTAGTIFLKYRAMKEAGEDRRRVELLLRSSRPNEYVLELIDQTFFDVRKKHEELQAGNHNVISAKSSSNDGVRTSWFLIDQAGDLRGFWSISEDEVAELAAHAADDSELRRRVEATLLTPWHSIGTKQDMVAKINSHISAWLRTRHDDSALKWQFKSVFQGTPRSAVQVLLHEDKSFTAQYELAGEFLGSLSQLPAHEQGVAVAIMVNGWMARAVGEPPETAAGRPNMSALIAEVTGFGGE